MLSAFTPISKQNIIAIHHPFQTGADHRLSAQRTQDKWPDEIIPFYRSVKNGVLRPHLSPSKRDTI
jgi:hypothetical protein